MDFPVKAEWHSWNYTSITGATGQVGGDAVDYDITQGNVVGGRLEFITIRGGRHEVRGRQTDRQTDRQDRRTRALPGAKPYIMVPVASLDVSMGD